MSKTIKKAEQAQKKHARLRERLLASIPAEDLLTGEHRTLYEADGWRIYVSKNRVFMDYMDPQRRIQDKSAVVDWSSMKLYDVPFDTSDRDTKWSREVRFVDQTSPVQLSIFLMRIDCKWTAASVELIRNSMTTYASGRFMIPDAAGDALLTLFVPVLAKAKTKKATKAA